MPPLPRYRIEHRLGAGATGVVHVALDTHLGRRVALKTLDARLTASERFRSRFHREADLLARLDSAHIVQVYDHGETDDTPWIATQLVAGGDLAQLLRSRGPLPPAVAAQVCAQVAEALATAHDAGIVHGDVKPSNVLVHDATVAVPHVYLCDFGVAVELGDAPSAAAPTVVGGTHAYLAPERGRGERPSPASDLYAVGCLLHECLTGRPPFTGADMAVLLAHAEQPPPRLGGTDATARALDATLSRALAKDPAARHPDARALAADLRAAAAPGAPARPRRRRAPVVLAAAGLAAALVAGLGVWAIAGDDDEVAGGGEAAASGSEDTQPTEQPTSQRTGPPPGDLDGDGLADLAITHDLSSDLATRLLPSTGTAFDDPQDFVTGASLVVTGDVDGDGVADIVSIGDAPGGGFQVAIVGTARDDTVVELENPAGLLPIYPMLGDVDGDGLADLMLPSDRSDESGTSVWVALSTGDGFEELAEWYAADHPPAEIVPGDFDGDGLVDLVINDLPDQTLRMLRSTGDGFVADVLGDDGVQRLSQQVRTPGVGDVDGDLADELVQVAGDDNDLLVVWELGADGFEQSTWLQLDEVDRMEQIQRSAPTVVDVDGDGFADVVRLLGEPDSPPQQVVVARSTGRGFEQPTAWAGYDCGCDGFVAPVDSMRTS